VHALLVMGSNPVVSAPDATRIAARLASLDVLVVADFFLSETASLADIVLPAAQWAEEDGTTTNLEGRVLRRRRAIDPPAGVRTDLDILCTLAHGLGAGRWFTDPSSAHVFNELGRATSGAPADYAGITYERLDAEHGEDGLFWPCPTPEHSGTPRLFADRFPTADGRARFTPVVHQPPAEIPTAEFPLHLTTGRVLAQYQSGTQTRRIASLCASAPEPVIEMHPAAAKLAGVRDGDTVQLSTPRGTARFTVRTTAAIREDTAFVPFHWGGEQSVNRLTNAALDPASRMPEFKICAARIDAVSEPHE
jgi:assimilatory nitrate reductase catalytic subunit